MNENNMINDEINNKLKQLEKIRENQRKASKNYYEKQKKIYLEQGLKRDYTNQIKYYEKNKETLMEKNRIRAKMYYEQNKERIQQKNLIHYYEKKEI